MAEAFADVGDVEARWRPLSGSEMLVAATLVDDASLQIRTEFSDVDSRIATGALDAAAPRAVVARMVRRALEAASIPEGAKSTQETVGPISFSVTYQNAASNLFMSASDRALLNGPNPARAKSVRLSPSVILR